jgi:hypothetical protein
MVQGVPAGREAGRQLGYGHHFSFCAESGVPHTLALPEKTLETGWTIVGNGCNNFLRDVLRRKIEIAARIVRVFVAAKSRAQTKSPGSICIEPGLAFACLPQAGLSAL